LRPRRGNRSDGNGAAMLTNPINIGTGTK